MKHKRPMTRSENMARVKSKNTKPEIFLRKRLWHKGLRYRLHEKNLPGTPDLYIPKYRAAVFVNGCFWHRHEHCRYASLPKHHHAFWQEKLTGNVIRDQHNYRRLEDMGIRVIVVWGCTIKQMMKDETTADRTVARLMDEITGQGE